jgi:hypothetical protein
MAWLDNVFKFLPFLRYNSVTPTLVNGDTSEAQCDASGRLLVNTQPANTIWQDSGAAVTEKQVKNAGGKLHQIFGRNTGGSDKYIFIFNSLTRPGNGATGQLFCPVKVKAGEAFSIDLVRPRAFSTGLFWSVSSTDATFTYDATAAFQVAVEYE